LIFIGIYIAYILHPSIGAYSRMVKKMCDLDQLLRVIGDMPRIPIACVNGIFIIDITYQELLQIQHLVSRPLISIIKEDEEFQLMIYSSPTELLRAITTGQLQCPGSEHQQAWTALCKRFGLVERTSADKVMNAAYATGIYALWGAVNAVKAVASLLNK
jgi:hypothetical protein